MTAQSEYSHCVVCLLILGIDIPVDPRTKTIGLICKQTWGFPNYVIMYPTLYDTYCMFPSIRMMKWYDVQSLWYHLYRRKASVCSKKSPCLFPLYWMFPVCISWNISPGIMFGEFAGQALSDTVLTPISFPKIWHPTHTEKSLQKFLCVVCQLNPLPWWQLCTLLAFSQPASWGSHLECI